MTTTTSPSVLGDVELERAASRIAADIRDQHADCAHHIGWCKYGCAWDPLWPAIQAANARTRARLFPRPAP